MRTAAKSNGSHCVPCPANMLDTTLLRSGWKEGSERRVEETSSTATVSVPNQLQCLCDPQCPEGSVNNTCVYDEVHTPSCSHTQIIK